MNASSRYAARTAAALLIAVVAPALVAHAQTTTTLTLSGTTATSGGVTIRSDQATTNQSTGATGAGAAPGGQIIVGQNGTTGRLRGLLEFDLSSLVAPAGQTIQINSVSLTMIGITGVNTTATPLTPVSFALSSYGFNPDATTATWNAPATGDATAGGTLGAALSTATGVANGTGNTANWVFGSTPAFTQAVLGSFTGDNAVRFLVNLPQYETANPVVGVTPQVFERFYSSNSVNSAAQQPALTVNYQYVSVAVPEAGSFALLAAGVGPMAFVIARRRKRQSQ